MILATEYVGHVVGGWEYVQTAYGVTLVALVAYGAYLFMARKDRS